MSAKSRTMNANIPVGRVHASLVSTTVAFALSKGFATDEIESVTGETMIRIMNPVGELSDHAMANLWAAIHKKFPDSSVSLEMARATPLTIVGGVANGTQYASTLNEALQLLVKNIQLFSNRAELVIKSVGKDSALVTSHPLGPVASGRVAELILAYIKRVISEVLSVKDCLRRVEFAHCLTGNLNDYVSFFEVPVLFDCQQTALVFKHNRFKASIGTANVELFSYVMKHFEQMLGQRKIGPAGSAYDKLLRAIDENSSIGEYRIRAVAERANMSVRSAQRIAFERGTSLQKLINESRSANARAFLRNSEIEIEKVASLVGYSDARAFRRAFKRWTSQSPGDFRRSCL